MPGATHPTRLVRFGPFQLDLSAGQLRKDGARVGLQEQPFQILAMLLERPGEVITREEFHSRLWPQGTFVDFEHGLNAAVKRLRDVLNDSADTPRYIETIPRRGYRFVAPIETPDFASATPKLSFKRRSAWLVGVAGLLVAAGAIAYWAWFIPKRSTPQGKVMLVVLPFRNLDDDPEQEFFSDGLTEELITQLSRISPEHLGIIARSTAMVYKGQKVSIDKIGRDLKVDYVMEGSVRREGNRIRISAQLSRVRGQTQIWADNFDHELSGILQLQEAVSRAIAENVNIMFAPTAREKATAMASVNPEAYTEYLKGRFLWHRLRVEALEQATLHFQRAIELDPSYAPAHLGLGDTYRIRGSWWGDLPPKVAFPEAKKHLRRALELEPSFGEALAGLAWIHFVFDWDWGRADADFRRAVQLRPNSRDTHSPYANYLRCMNRFEEARREISLSLQLDPLSPLEITEDAVLSLTEQKSQEALQKLEMLHAIDPDFPGAIWALAYVYASLERTDQAVRILDEEIARPLPNRMCLALRGTIYAVQGNQKGAHRIIERLIQNPLAAQMRISLLYKNLGNKAKALEWLEKAYEERDPQLVWFAQATPENAPFFWPEPRFQRILRAMNFPTQK